MAENPKPVVYTVSGTIYDEFDSPLQNVIIKVYDKDLRTEKLLASSKKPTDEKGNYKVSFKKSLPSSPEYKTADVFIKVLNENGESLGQSPVHFNVGENTTINFKVGNTEIKSTNEFDALVQKLKLITEPHGVSLGDLKEPDDFSFLAGETNEDSEKIAFINTAYRISDGTGIDPAIFYGLFRMGFPVELNELLQIRSTSIIKALKQAIEDNIISSRWLKELDKIIIVFNNLAVTHIFEESNRQSESFKKVLGSVLIDEQQKIFAKTYFTNEDDIENFWNKLKDQPQFTDNTIVENTKRVLRINMLTSNQPELTNHLFKLQSQDPDLKEDRGFAKLTKADWAIQIENAGVVNYPEWVNEKAPEKKKENYAEALEQLHKQLYPTTFFAQRLKKDTGSSFLLKEELGKFFEKNPDYDLQTNKIQKEFDQSDFSGNQNIDELKKELIVLNLLYKITGEYSYVNTLHSKELNSVTDIVNKYGKEQFNKEFAASLGGIETASKIYNGAMSIHNKITALLAAYKMRHDIKLYAMDGNNEAPEGYHEMFGDGELCECEHCQSVYSPSAYFVDILNFIKGHSNNEDAFKLLLNRRPDLDNISLTCKNTNTPLPYIDLVNELLEKEVVKTAIALDMEDIIDNEGITEDDHSYQTTGEAAELAAMPEHINNDAYKALEKAGDEGVFSSHLPLDLPLEETRIYTEKLGWKRIELLEVFYGKNEPGKYNDPALAAELFGFSSAELKIINGVNSFNVTMPDTIKTLLGQTKLSYIDLLQLLETYFLNPLVGENRVLHIEPKPGEDELTCSLEKLTITGANDAWLNKMARFIRLWKKSGWDIFDLDRTLKAIGVKDFPATEQEFNDTLLIPLSHIERIHLQLNLPLREVITFFSHIDTVIYKDHSKEGQPVISSLYEQVFLNKAVSDPVNTAFEILSGNLADYTEALCAVLNIKDIDLLLLIQEGGEISIESLSRLYRDSLLAKALRTSIQDAQAIISITGKKPVNGIWSTLNLLEFLDEWKLFKSSGISADEFQTLISNKVGEDYKLPIEDSLITFVGDEIEEFRLSIDDTSIKEEDRKAKFIEKLNEFLSGLKVEADPITSLENNNLIHPDDLSLKKAIENYLDDKYKEILEQLTIEEFINKLTELKNSLSEYLFLKTTPLVFKKLGFDIIQIQWLKNKKVGTGTSILWNDTIEVDDPELYPAFRKLLYLSQLNKIKIDPSLSWTDLLNIVIGNEGEEKKEWFDTFIRLFSVSESNLDFLIDSKDEINNKGRLNLTFPVDYVEANHLIEVLHCCKTIDKLGGNIDQITSMLKSDSDVEPNNIDPDDAQAVKDLLKSRYSNSEWLNIIKPINDNFRIRRRDALLAWLLSTSPELENDPLNPLRNKWNDTNGIYANLLIDVDMDACMVTSRIKQAISSVQLFIDRSLMNLEYIIEENDEDDAEDDDKVYIQLDEDFARQWHQWRKQYRYWEANRKVFLYPENWIEPDLRDDKSPFFKELESQLKQNEVTEETAKEALLTYLEKLDRVANLEMVGLFNDEGTKIVHVFGRTRNIPHQYYYRKQQNSFWTAWEKVDLDLESDHILPVVWNGRLMLFWGQFTEKQDEDGGSTNIEPTGDNGSMTMKSESALKYLEMKLAWSEYKKGKWDSKKVSKIVKSIVYVADKKQLSLVSLIVEGKLFVGLIDTYTTINDVTFSTFHYPFFYFDYCDSSPSLGTPYYSNADPISDLRIPEGLSGNYMFMDEIVGIDESLKLFKSGFFRPYDYADYAYDGDYRLIPIFNNTPGKFQIMPDHHEIEKEKALLFFYRNNEHNFYVRSQEIFNPHVPDEYLIGNSGTIIARRVQEFGKNISVNSNGASVYSLVPRSGIEVPDSITKIKEVSVDPYINFKGKKYLFQTFYHPYVCKYIKELNEIGIDSLYNSAIQVIHPKVIFNTTKYNPTSLVLTPYPTEKVDFSFTGSYSLYNWELFFHIPLLIATGLSQNQKFEEARKWFHYIFNPTKFTGDGEGSEKFWITKSFRKEIRDGVLSLEDLLGREEYADDLNEQLNNWEQNPFNPHAVARLRISAYMRNTVLRYIDNLIAWGDQLFQKDTIESINEATLLYILASNILGKKQEKVPQRTIPVESSFDDIDEVLDPFGNAKVKIASFIFPSDGADDILLMPLFCLPKNDSLLKYWDTVADRLFKIRHCQNIEGVFRQLPLFEPPIDPALLVRAAAAGLDLNTILSDINTGLPHYRFQIMLQKANELCNDVKMLGGSLLSALEKKDAEELALLRSEHELKMLEMIRDVREKQIDEAQQNLHSLQASKAVIEERRNYYTQNASVYLNSAERTYFDLSKKAIGIQEVLEMKNYLSSILYLTPEFKLGVWSTIGTTLGGNNFGKAVDAASNALQSIAAMNRLQAESANMKGGYDRRKDEWTFQANSAELELKQIEKQIIAAEIRLAIVEKDLENHDQQIEHTGEVDDYMRGKFTNAELYHWMVGQLSTVYFQSYQMAYTTAKKAEKCLQHELGLETSNYIQYGYWDSLKKGLLSGEKLQYDLRRLENAYLEENKREYELTKHISLAMLDPLALIKLRSTGISEFHIPEVLYDMDYPGQYFRRLKSVSISLPCITGPYTSVSAKLTLENNKVRKDPDDTSEYQEDQGNDSRFIYNIGPKQSIAVSSSQNDSGVFELNFRDERYLPFEGSGAISSWKMELPTEVRQFDYNTISDVIIHVKYTAREKDNNLETKANESLKNLLASIKQELDQVGLHVGINLKHDLSSIWHLLKKNDSVELKIDKSRLPYMAQTLAAGIAEVIFIAKLKNNAEQFTINIRRNSDETSVINLIRIETTNPDDPATTIDWKLYKGAYSGGEYSRIAIDMPFMLSASPEDLTNLEELMLVVKYELSNS